MKFIQTTAFAALFTVFFPHFASAESNCIEDDEFSATFVPGYAVLVDQYQMRDGWTKTGLRSLAIRISDGMFLDVMFFDKSELFCITETAFDPRIGEAL